MTPTTPRPLLVVAAWAAVVLCCCCAPRLAVAIGSLSLNATEYDMHGAMNVSFVLDSAATQDAVVVYTIGTCTTTCAGGTGTALVWLYTCGDQSCVNDPLSGHLLFADEPPSEAGVASWPLTPGGYEVGVISSSTTLLAPLVDMHIRGLVLSNHTHIRGQVESLDVTFSTPSPELNAWIGIYARGACDSGTCPVGPELWIRLCSTTDDTCSSAVESDTITVNEAWAGTQDWELTPGEYDVVLNQGGSGGTVYLVVHGPLALTVLPRVTTLELTSDTFTIGQPQAFEASFSLESPNQDAWLAVFPRGSCDSGVCPSSTPTMCIRLCGTTAALCASSVEVGTIALSSSWGGSGDWPLPVGEYDITLNEGGTNYYNVVVGPVRFVVRKLLLSSTSYNYAMDGIATSFFVNPDLVNALSFMAVYPRGTCYDHNSTCYGQPVMAMRLCGNATCEAATHKGNLVFGPGAALGLGSTSTWPLAVGYYEVAIVQGNSSAAIIGAGGYGPVEFNVTTSNGQEACPADAATPPLHSSVEHELAHVRTHEMAPSSGFVPSTAAECTLVWDVDVGNAVPSTLTGVTREPLVIMGCNSEDGVGRALLFVALDPSSAQYTHVTTLAATDDTTAIEFGRSVAIKGLVAFVAAPLTKQGGVQTGAVYVFASSDHSDPWAAWSQVQKILPVTSSWTRPTFISGRIVVADRAVSDADATPATGLRIVSASDQAYGLFGCCIRAGALHMYQLKASGEYEHEVLFAGAADSEFGSDVSLHGEWLAVGAKAATAGVSAGSVKIYRHDGDSWLLKHDFAGNTYGTATGFGASVSLLGGVLCVGAPVGDDATGGGGAGYIFERQVGTPYTWQQTTSLKPSPSCSDMSFGESASLTERGCVLGASGAQPYGAAFLFHPSSEDAAPLINSINATDGTGDWAQRFMLTSVTTAPSAATPFGIAITGAGDTVVVASQDVGAVQAFHHHDALLGARIDLHSNYSGDNANLGDEVAIAAGDTLVVASVKIDSEAGAVWLYTRNGSAAANHSTAWDNHQVLRGLAAEDRFGFALSVSRNGLVAVGAYSGLGGDGYVNVYAPHCNNHWDAGAAERRWQLAATLTLPIEHAASYGSVSRLYGYDVALDKHTGSMLVVTAPYATASEGMAFVYERQYSGDDSVDGSWVFTQRLQSSTSGLFGIRAAATIDTIAVSLENSPSSSVVVFTRTLHANGGWLPWEEVALLEATDFIKLSSLALDGDMLGVGYDQSNALASNSGSVYVWLRPGDGWSSTAHRVTLVRDQGPATAVASGEFFGEALAIDADYGWVWVGAWGYNSFTGITQLFSVARSNGVAGSTRDGSDGVVARPLLTMGAQDFSFAGQTGRALAIDGPLVAVGSPGTDSLDGAIHLLDMRHWFAEPALDTLDDGAWQSQQLLALATAAEPLASLDATQLSRLEHTFLQSGCATSGVTQADPVFLQPGSYLVPHGGLQVRSQDCNILTVPALDATWTEAVRSATAATVTAAPTVNKVLPQVQLLASAQGAAAFTLTSSDASLSLHRASLQRQATTAWGSPVTTTSRLVTSAGSVDLVHCELSGGSAALGGAVLASGSTSSLQVHHSNVANSSATSGGAIAVAQGATATLVGGLLTGNTATANGGAIAVDTSSSLTLSGTDGGGIVRGNAAAGSGGALYVGLEATLDATSWLLEGNVAGSQGGALAVHSSTTVSLLNTSFVGNAATQGGGAFVNADGITVALTDCTFTSNCAAGRGGGLAVERSSVAITGETTTFGGNSAGDVDISAAGTTFTTNAPATTCAAQIVSGGQGVIASSFAATDSAGNGGAVYAVFSSVELTGATIEDGVASAGAGLYLFGGNVDMANTKLQYNAAASHGGAVACESSANLAASTLSVQDNWAQLRGGGVALDDCLARVGDGSDFTRNSVHALNSSTGVLLSQGGGALYVSLSDQFVATWQALHAAGALVVLDDSVEWTENSAPYGGAIEVASNVGNSSCDACVAACAAAGAAAQHDEPVAVWSPVSAFDTNNATVLQNAGNMLHWSNAPPNGPIAETTGQGLLSGQPIRVAAVSEAPPPHTVTADEVWPSFAVALHDVYGQEALEAPGERGAWVVEAKVLGVYTLQDATDAVVDDFADVPIGQLTSTSTVRDCESLDDLATASASKAVLTGVTQARVVDSTVSFSGVVVAAPPFANVTIGFAVLGSSAPLAPWLITVGVNLCGPGTEPSDLGCVACPDGQFSGNGSHCIACPEGYVSEGGEGATECVPCGVGMERVGIACERCAVGFNSSSLAGDCGLCGLGTIAPSTGAATCLPCLPGTQATAGRDACVACADNEVSEHGQECEQCLPAHRPNATFTACQACPNGTFGDAFGRDCQPCDAGWWSEEGQLECERCPLGSVSASGSAGCTPCVNGTAPSAWNDTCVPCEANEASPGGQQECTVCGEGWRPNYLRTACEKCPAGTFGIDGAVCKECGVGTWSDEGASSCTDCADGSVSTVGSPACTPCVNGTAPNADSSQCVPCEANEVSPGGQQVCTVCSAGWRPDDLRTACEKCPAGTYGIDGAVCKECSAGWWSEEGATQCQRCALGSVAKPGCYECTPCVNGTAPSAWNDTCVPCEANEASPGGQQECTVCDAGWRPSALRTECERCPNGTFGVDGAVCRDCGAGLWSGEGATECEACAPGSVSSSGSPGCTPCVNGTAPNADNSQCVPCEAFSVSPGGEQECTVCSAGWRPSDLRTQCEKCPAGTYGLDGAVCKECSAGWWSGEGATQCQRCGLGSVSQVGSPSCVACVNGTAPSAWNDTCVPCEANGASPGGQQVCTVCSAGWRPDYLRTACEKCPAGTFGIDGAVCKECGVGTWSAEGASSCTECSDGSVSTAGSPACTPCVNGTAPNADSSQCVPCEANEASPGSQEVCTVCSAGWRPDYLRTACEKCPAGTYGIDGAVCKECGTGQWSGEGAMECEECTPGSVAKVGSPSCDVCPVGTEPSSSKDVCVSCPSNGVSPGGEASCTICGSGWRPSALRDVCEKCPAGMSGVGGASCSDCGVGTWSDEGASSCTDCSDGSVSTAGSPACTPCINGTAPNADSSQCVPCEANEASPGSQQVCTVCSAGWRPNYLRTECEQCPAGTYGIDGAVCKECGTGQWSGEGATQCEECTPGSVAKVGSPSCDVCPVGTEPSGAKDVCVSCPANGVSPGGEASCTICGSGWRPSAMRTVCEKCPAGMSGVGGASCSDCGVGTWSAEGASSCTDCADGSVSTVGSPACTPCVNGTAPNADSSQCVPCEANQASPGSQQVCTVCSAGWRPNYLRTACEKCPAGTFGIDGAVCKECGTGQWSGEGAMECEECIPGSVAKVGSPSCDACPVGTEPSSAKDVCVSCPSNGVSPGGEASCTICGSGWRPSALRDVCEKCPAGMSGVGGASCSDCGVGTWSDEGASSCTDCSDGSVSTAGSPACTLCINGTAPSADSSQCVPCEANEASPGSQQVCTVCSAGWRPNYLRTACEQCPAGTYGIDGAVCKECGTGQWSGEGATKCEECTPGSVAKVGSPSCDVCPVGTEPSSAKDVCVSCPSNGVSPGGEASCTICGSGWRPSALRDVCEKCPAGMSGVGGTSCSDCGVGTWSDEGASSCTDCSDGSVSTVGSPACTLCVNGTAPNADSSQCVPCEANEASPGSQQVCTVCSAGWRPNYLRTECEQCPAGTYGIDGAVCKECGTGQWSGEGATKCEECTPGSVAKVGSPSCDACPVGTEPSSAKDVCVSCPANGVSPGGEAACTICGSGWRPSALRDVCERCPAGTLGIGGASCSDCGAGTWSNRAAISCTECAAGSVAPAGSPGCTFCVNGTAPNADNSQCVPCEANEASPGSQQVCTVCSAGWRPNYLRTACEKCPAGTYSLDGAVCKECGTGQWSGEGATQCEECTPGSVAKVGSPSCDVCPVGTEPSSSKDVCVACPANGASPGGEASCTICDPGWHPSAMRTVCEKCPAGTFGAGATCSDCPAGWSSRETSIACTQCGAGYAAPVGSPSCIRCYNGTVPSTAKDTCVNCPDNAVAKEGDDACVTCEPGWGPNPTRTLCGECIGGTYSKDGAPCVQCPSGSSSPAGATQCTECAAGQVSPQGGPTCLSCPVGTAPSEARDTCVDCPANGAAGAQQAACEVCEPGHAPSSLRTHCVECGAGYSSPTGEQCHRCEVYEYSPAGSAACLQCDAGKIPHPVDRDRCVPCAPGTAPVGGVCEPCSDPVAAPNGTACSKCAPGFIPDTVNKNQCVQCPSGAVRPSTAVSCTSCPDGFYASGNHIDCVKCPSVGVLCKAGILVILPGYWSPTIADAIRAAQGNGGSSSSNLDNFTFAIDESTEFFECRDGACDVGTNGTLKCGEGRTGPLCAVCMENHYKCGDTCAPCHDGARNTVILVLAIIACVVFAAVLAWRAAILWRVVPRRRRRRQEPSGGSDAWLRNDPTQLSPWPVIRTGITYLQTIAMMNDFGISWPTIVSVVWSGSAAITSVPVDSNYVACTIPTTAYDRFWMVVPLPLIVLVVIFVFMIPCFLSARKETARRRRIAESARVTSPGRAGGAGAGAGAGKVDSARRAYEVKHYVPEDGQHFVAPHSRRTPTSDMWGHFTAIVLMLEYLLYPAVAKFAIAMLDCSADIQGTRYLAADYSIACGTAKHTLHAALGVLVVVFFALAFPLVTGFLLWRRRQAKRLYAGDLRQKALFLYLGYRDDVCWWESVVFLRKLGLVVAAAALASGKYQAYTALFVLLVAVAVHVAVHPFENYRHARLETVSLLTACLSVYLGLLFVVARSNNTAANDEDGGGLIAECASGTGLTSAAAWAAAILVLVANLFCIIIFVKEVLRGRRDVREHTLRSPSAAKNDVELPYSNPMQQASRAVSARSLRRMKSSRSTGRRSPPPKLAPTPTTPAAAAAAAAASTLQSSRPQATPQQVAAAVAALGGTPSPAALRTPRGRFTPRSTAGDDDNVSVASTPRRGRRPRWQQSANAVLAANRLRRAGVRQSPRRARTPRRSPRVQRQMSAEAAAAAAFASPAELPVRTDDL